MKIEYLYENANFYNTVAIMFIEWTMKNHLMIVTACNYYNDVICIKVNKIVKDPEVKTPLYDPTTEYVDDVCDSYDNSEWHLNFVVVVVLFLVLEVYDLHLGFLFLVSGLTQKYEKCNLVCQVNGRAIFFSDIRAPVWRIICYMKVMGTMKHE